MAKTIIIRLHICAGGDKLDFLKRFLLPLVKPLDTFANIDKYITVSDTGTAGSANQRLMPMATVTDDVS
ncbi:MAG: hypothetical protein H0A76_05850 [Candidatus Thiodubiliella endoseptemdiera]|uniref:Uncharacterized protein n=1 Tax=Candidatus Thiodubiliella endoseptemdiera TaxID=2738886 RepID=A0A853F1B8_9GAMM|nr:hypothetical protein [Candidatus Thiodubiliella endoseptemdiera]